MLASPIDNLNYGYTIDERFFKLSLLGPIDTVRKAARDAVFGLNLLGGIEAKCKHVSEIYKSRFPDENAQIDICIGLKEFERLVLLFRYCNQIGLKINANELFVLDNKETFSYRINETTSGIATLGGYLAAAKRIADENNDPLEIKDYPLPINHNFWFKDEIAAYDKKNFENYKTQKMEHLLFFNQHPDNPEAKEKLIKARIENIINRVEDMVNSHPKNPNNFKGSIGWCYLNNYIQLQDHLQKEPNLLVENPEYFKEAFFLIRNQDLERFKLLAKKYLNLQEQLRELKEHTQEKNVSRTNFSACKLI